MPSFLQSREWATILSADGTASSMLTCGAEEIRYFREQTPGGFFYFYAPRPIVRDLKAFNHALLTLKTSGALFFRLEPEKSVDWNQVSLPTVATQSVQPRENAVIEIESDEEMLARMHPKSRYNVRLAERHGIRVQSMTGSDALEIFFRLIVQTARRDGFRTHSMEHYKNLTEHNSHEFGTELFVAQLDTEPVAIAMINFYGDTATYLHGGSDERLKRYMAPYVLHWEVAREARRRGLTFYDLGGVDELRWPGLTRFKMGLGARVKKYPETRDIVFRPVPSAIYRIARRLRRSASFI